MDQKPKKVGDTKKKKNISRAWAMGQATHSFDGKKWKQNNKHRKG